MSWPARHVAHNRQHIDEKQLVGALLSAAPAHPGAVAGVRTLTPQSSSKSLRDKAAKARDKASAPTLVIPTISVTPAEGDEDEDGDGRRDSFLAAQEAIAAARGVFGDNAAALEDGAESRPQAKAKGKGKRGRKHKPKPLLTLDEEKHGTSAPISQRSQA